MVASIILVMMADNYTGSTLLKKKTKVWDMEMTLVDLRTHDLISQTAKVFPTIIITLLLGGAFKITQGVE